MEKIWDLGIKRDFTKHMMYYVKKEADGNIGVYHFEQRKKSEKLCNTPIPWNEGNTLNWYFVKSDAEGNLSLYKTVRKPIVPGQKLKWKLKTEKLKQVVIELPQ